MNQIAHEESMEEENEEEVASPVAPALDVDAMVDVVSAVVEFSTQRPHSTPNERSREYNNRGILSKNPDKDVCVSGICALLGGSVVDKDRLPTGSRIAMDVADIRPSANIICKKEGDDIDKNSVASFCSCEIDNAAGRKKKCCLCHSKTLNYNFSFIPPPQLLNVVNARTADRRTSCQL
jgi:hypothetical protein